MTNDDAQPATAWPQEAGAGARAGIGAGAGHRAEPCLNCAAALTGPWCARCGQSEEARHRSLRHLGIELAEAMTHADSRLWSTLGRLAWRPDRLTRDYLEGHRVSQLPPLRLLLIALFLLFTLAFLLARPMHVHAPRSTEAAAATAELQHEIAGSDADLRDVRQAFAHDEQVRGLEHWARARVAHAVGAPAEFLRIVGDWAERFAILMLPASALMLALLFAGRGFTLFDHLVFSMHSITASAIVLLVVIVANEAGVPQATLLLLLPVLHLFRHMRGVYGTGVPGTLVRMAVLGLGSAVIFTLLAAGLAVLAIALAG